MEHFIMQGQEPATNTEYFCTKFINFKPFQQGSRKLEPLEPPVPDKSHLVGQNEI
jgi:hypothetical protein